MRRSRNFLITFFLSATLCISAVAQSVNNAAPKRSHSGLLNLPWRVKDSSVLFAVIGDTGSGSSKQREVGDMMGQYRALYPFEFVLMMGDNMYGGETPQDFVKKFAEPYKALL